jgi:hypothetical protein
MLPAPTSLPGSSPRPGPPACPSLRCHTAQRELAARFEVEHPDAFQGESASMRLPQSHYSAGGSNAPRARGDVGAGHDADPAYSGRGDARIEELWAPGSQRVPSQDSRTTRAAAQSVPMNGNPARLSGRISDTNGRKPEYPAKALRELTSPQTRSLPSAPCAMWMLRNRTVGGSRSCSATSRWSVANDGSVSAAVVVIAAGGQIAAPISAAAPIMPAIGLFPWLRYEQYTRGVAPVAE